MNKQVYLLGALRGRAWELRRAASAALAVASAALLLPLASASTAAVDAASAASSAAFTACAAQVLSPCGLLGQHSAVQLFGRVLRVNSIECAVLRSLLIYYA